MPNKTHRAPLRYKIPDFFSSLLGQRAPDRHLHQLRLAERSQSTRHSNRYLTENVASAARNVQAIRVSYDFRARSQGGRPTSRLGHPPLMPGLVCALRHEFVHRKKFEPARAGLEA